jgi:hypothetical protein
VQAVRVRGGGQCVLGWGGGVNLRGGMGVNSADTGVVKGTDGVDQWCGQ